MHIPVKQKGNMKSMRKFYTTRMQHKNFMDKDIKLNSSIIGSLEVQERKGFRGKREFLFNWEQSINYRLVNQVLQQKFAICHQKGE